MALGDDQGLVSQKREARLRTLTVATRHAEELGWGWTQVSKSERCPRPCAHVCTTEMAPCPSPFRRGSAEDRRGLHDMVLWWNPVPFVRVLPRPQSLPGPQASQPSCQFSLQVGPSGNPLPVFEFRSVIYKKFILHLGPMCLSRKRPSCTNLCLDNFMSVWITFLLDKFT